MTRQRSPSLFQSFNYAAEGIVHAVRTQRNLWIHFAIAVAVLVAAIGFGATKLELAVLLLAITFVLVAELVNTAVEAAVDVASTSFDPMAKIAKDIAAGAVLVAALNARRRRLPRLLGRGRDAELAVPRPGSRTRPRSSRSSRSR